MQKHRIFIAINLPEKAKKELYEQQYKWLELPCRWTKKENLHITLAFIGYLNTEDLPEICRITEEVATSHEPFFLSLNKIIYGPSTHSTNSGQVSSGQAPSTHSKNPSNPSSGPKDSEKIPLKSPRMVWVVGQESRELGKIKQDLENSLAGFSSESKREKGKSVSPHITLGRLKTWEFRNIEPEERPEINEEINFNFEVKSMEIMESRLGKKGPEYCILESVTLGSSV